MQKNIFLKKYVSAKSVNFIQNHSKEFACTIQVMRVIQVSNGWKCIFSYTLFNVPRKDGNGSGPWFIFLPVCTSARLIAWFVTSININRLFWNLCMFLGITITCFFLKRVFIGSTTCFYWDTQTNCDSWQSMDSNLLNYESQTINCYKF